MGKYAVGFATGGARPGAGRPKKEVVITRDQAVELANRYISDRFGEVIDLALKLCKGVRRRKFYPPHHPTRPGKMYYEVEYDSAMIRFWIERFVPPAKQTIGLEAGSGFESLIQEIEAAKAKAATPIEAEPAQIVEPTKEPDGS